VLTVDGSGSVTANFALPITFTESGLPWGATWSVTFNGQTQSATVGPSGGTSMTFYVSADGSYSWSAKNVGWAWYTYYPNPSSGTMNVPSQTSQTITYSTNSFSYTWTPSGLTSGTWGVTVYSPNGKQYGSWSASAGQSITQNFPVLSSGSYTYTISAPSGWSASPSSGSFSSSGSQTVKFSYSYTWYEKGLPSSQYYSWGITLNGQTYWASGTYVTVTGLSGSYSWSVNAPSGYSASPSSGTISGPGSTTITFTKR
jgi:phage terminase large subunit-like protein